jgi:hypothetical protein
MKHSLLVWLLQRLKRVPGAIVCYFRHSDQWIEAIPYGTYPEYVCGKCGRGWYDAPAIKHC